MKRTILLASLLFAALPAAVLAQSKLESDKPIEIASDNLEVQQDQQKAIFSGNVIAKQGNITMRSATMTVYYNNNSGGAEKTEGGGQGIDRIEADGNVVFVTPEETAQGDHAVYRTSTNTVDLTGNVVLTREENILKGSALNYNMTTKRSVLSAGSTGRVRGLFVPGKDGK